MKGKFLDFKRFIDGPRVPYRIIGTYSFEYGIHLTAGHEDVRNHPRGKKYSVVTYYINLNIVILKHLITLA